MEDTLMDDEFLDLERGKVDDIVKQPWTHLMSAGRNFLLHIAADLGKKDEASSLLSSLTDPSDVYNALLRQNARGDTPLHCAARKGNQTFVRCLVSTMSRNDDEKRVLLRMQNRQGDTALHLAARNNHLEVVDMLMNEDPVLGSIPNNSGECPLYVAAYKGYLKITGRLVESNATGPRKRNALHVAFLKKHGDVVKLLLARRPELCRERDDTGCTPLLCLDSFTDYKMVKAILDKDVSIVLLSDENGLSALHVAAAVGCIPVLKEILRRRFDFSELINNSGKTFLHVAIENRRTDVVKYVLKGSGFKELLNQPDHEGNTPLHHAVITSNYIIVRILLVDKRVVLDNVNQKGQSPIDLAYSIRLDSPNEIITRMITRSLKAAGLRCSLQRWDNYSNNWRNKREDSEQINRRRAITNYQAIVAILIATVTFGAAITLPGGYKNDPGTHDQGMAILTKSAAFKVFLIFDTLAMMTSLVVIWFLFGTESWHHHQRLLFLYASEYLQWLSVLEMGVAFVAGVFATVSRECLWLAIIICIIVCSVPLYILITGTWIYGTTKPFRIHQMKLKRRKEIQKQRTSL